MILDILKFYDITVSLYDIRYKIHTIIVLFNDFVCQQNLWLSLICQIPGRALQLWSGGWKFRDNFENTALLLYSVVGLHCHSCSPFSLLSDALASNTAKSLLWRWPFHLARMWEFEKSSSFFGKCCTSVLTVLRFVATVELIVKTSKCHFASSHHHLSHAAS